MDTCGLRFETCGWHEPRTSRTTQGSGFRKHFARGQSFTLTRRCCVDRKRVGFDLSPSLRMCQAVMWSLLIWGGRWSEGDVDLRGTLVDDGTLRPGGRTFDISALTYTSHVRLSQLRVAVNHKTSLLSTTEIYPPAPHTIAQCAAQGHMAGDGHVSRGRDQTCDLFFLRADNRSN